MTQTPKTTKTTKKSKTPVRPETPATPAAEPAAETGGLKLAAIARPTLDDILAEDIERESYPDCDPEALLAMSSAGIVDRSGLTLPEAANDWQHLVNETIRMVDSAPYSKAQVLISYASDPVRKTATNPAVATKMSAKRIAAEIAALKDPYARRVGESIYRPRIMMSAGPLVALVGLAQSIGSIGRLAELAQPGSFTMLEGLLYDDPGNVAKLFEWGLAPLVNDTGPLEVFEISGKYNKTAALSAEMLAVAGHGKAVILLADTEFQPPPPVAATVDTVLSLPVPDAEGLVYLLRLSHSTTGQIAEEAVRQLLPSNAALAQLTIREIVMALRKPTALAVAAHLAKLGAKRIKPGRRFDDYPMSPKLRAEARRLIDDIRAFRDGRRAWADCLKGILLSGPPGVGKTDFARMIAAEAGVNLSELGPSKTHPAGHLGDAIRLINSGFAAAKKDAPAIIFLDEMDAMGCRGTKDRNSGYRNGLVAGYLAALDGVEGRPGVFVLAASNHPDLIDPALIRAGRFDRHLHIDLPEPDLLVPILRWHLDGDLAGADLNPLIPAAMGKSPADLALAVRDARAAARDDDRPVAVADLMAALSGGEPMPADKRARVALHEAGHAVVRYVLTGTLPKRMMITPGGGEVHSRVDRLLVAEDFRIELAILLAGRTAEKLFLGEASAGSGGAANSDLACATRLAASFEASTGLGTSGLLWLGSPTAAAALVPRDDDLADRVTAHLNDAETRAAEVLRKAKPLVTALASALNQRGYLEQAEIGQVLTAAA